MLLDPAGADPAPSPAVVLGFGRSGTTWLADVISRATRGLVLFEPLHPSAAGSFASLAYTRPGDEPGRLVAYLRSVLEGAIRHPWLLRNHVSAPLTGRDHRAADELWRHPVVGFKDIRANFALNAIYRYVTPRVAFVVRDPQPVVASVLRRPGFFEWGWPATYELFCARAVFARWADGSSLEDVRKEASAARTPAERVAVMWLATHVFALDELRRCGLPLFAYEQLVDRGLAEFERLFDHLSLSSLDLAAGHLEHPSATTASPRDDRRPPMSTADHTAVDRIAGEMYSEIRRRLLHP